MKGGINMYEEREEKNYDFNWVSLLIKVVIFVLFVLLAIWLVTKFINRDDKDGATKFDANIQLMKNAAIKYFVDDKLPSEEGKTNRLTLQEMINKKLVGKLTDNSGKSCDSKNSYAAVTKVDDYYSMKVLLKCGEMEDYIYTTVGSEECIDCDNVIGKPEEKKEDNKNKDKNNSSSKNETKTNDKKTDDDKKQEENKKDETTNNKDNTANPQDNTDNSQKSGQKLYYEHAKIVTNTKTVNNYKYCRQVSKDIYTVPYVRYGTTSNNYTLILKSIPSNASTIVISGVRGIDSDSDFRGAYAGSKGDIAMLGDNGKGHSSKGTYEQFKAASLKRTKNISVTMSAPYSRSGSYLTDVRIGVKNFNGVNGYYSKEVNANIYFAPVHFKLSYINNDDCYTSRNYPMDGYKQVNTWTTTETEKVVDKSNTKWSTSPSLEGYEATGNIQWK